DLRDQPPRAGDVLDERVRLELSENLDLEEAGVDEVVDDEIDDAIAPAERDGRLGAVARERIEALAHPAGQDHGQNVATRQGAVHCWADCKSRRSGRAAACPQLSLCNR